MRSEHGEMDQIDQNMSNLSINNSCFVSMWHEHREMDKIDPNMNINHQQTGHVLPQFGPNTVKWTK